LYVYRDHRHSKSNKSQWRADGNFLENKVGVSLKDVTHMDWGEKMAIHDWRAFTTPIDEHR
jgi:hypothetical protein